jgi:hypothetical protein
VCVCVCVCDVWHFAGHHPLDYWDPNTTNATGLSAVQANETDANATDADNDSAYRW